MSDLAVDFDQHVVLGGHVVAALADDGVDPVGERFPHDGVEDIYEPLSWEPVPIGFIRQEVEHVGMLLRLREDLLDAEAGVLWRKQIGDLGALDVYNMLQGC